jgi:hypothetical protein
MVACSTISSGTGLRFGIETQACNISARATRNAKRRDGHRLSRWAPVSESAIILKKGIWPQFFEKSVPDLVVEFLHRENESGTFFN